MKRYIVLLGDTQPNANKFLDNIRREFEDNEELARDFPHCRPGDVWRTEALELTSETLIEALCFGRGKIRGRRYKHYRPDLVLIDDPQNDDDALNHELLEKDEQWLQSDVMNAGEPGTNYILIGTALVDRCLVLQHANRPTWNHKTYKSLIAEPQNMHLWQQWWNILCKHEDPERVEKAKQWYLQHKSGEAGMDYGAQVLWPDRVPLTELMLKKFTNPRAFASEHQGQPMPPGSAEFGPELFDYEGFWFDEWPEGNLIELYGLDPSKGNDSKAGDYQAFCRCVVDRYYQFWVELWLEKMNVTEMCYFMADLWKNRPGEATVLEANMFQELMSIPMEDAAKKNDVDMRIYKIVNTVPKPVRIRRLTPHLTQHKIKFKRNSKGAALCVEQLKGFRHPSIRGSHDDGPDVLEATIRIAFRLVNEKASA